MSSSRQARIILLMAVLVELALFAGSSLNWYRQHRGPARPLTLNGEGLYLRSDGIGYYAWLGSLLADGDWSFDNDFDLHNPMNEEIPTSNNRTRLDLRANPWSIGPACLWSLTIVPTHGLLLLLEPLGLPWPVDAYSLPYQVLAGLTTLLGSFLSLWLLYQIACRFTDPVRAALAADFLTLGSTMVYYNAGEVSMGHGPATLAVALLVWYWLRSYGSEHAGRWLVVGLLVGVAAMMRWQMGALCLLPAGEWFWLGGRRRLQGLVLAGFAAFVGSFPQLLAWRVVYGDWLTSPVTMMHHWLQPDLVRVLFGTDRSLFYWTPITLLACLGCLLFLKPKHEQPLTRPALLLASVFALQVYVLASVMGDSRAMSQGVFLGCAFGCRQLTEGLVLVLPGLAALLAALPERSCRRLCAFAGLLVVWNLTLVGLFCLHLLPRNAGATPPELLAAVLTLIRQWPILGLGVLAAAVVVPLTLLRLPFVEEDYANSSGTATPPSVIGTGRSAA